MGPPLGESATSGIAFSQVLSDELEQVARRRRGPSPTPVIVDTTAAGAAPPSEEALREAALDAGLVGLALSGGGVRSATFNLGVLQALADFGLLKHFDYLSTVSGGGYIGAWLTAWIKRDGSVGNVEKQLKVTRADQAWAKRTALVAGPDGIEERPLAPGEVRQQEPAPIQHLRANSSYLAPWLGLFSADVWVLGAVYLRNLLLNQAVMLPAVLFVLFAIRLIYWASFKSHNAWWNPVAAMAGVVVCVTLALFGVIYSLWRLREIGLGHSAKRVHLQLNPSMLHVLVLLPLLVAAMLTCRVFVSEGSRFWLAFGEVFVALAHSVGLWTDSGIANDRWWGAMAGVAVGLAAGGLLLRTVPAKSGGRNVARRTGALLIASGVAAFVTCSPLVPANEQWWQRAVACGGLGGVVFLIVAAGMQLAALMRFVWAADRWGWAIAGRSLVGAVAGLAVALTVGISGWFVASLPFLLINEWAEAFYPGSVAALVLLSLVIGSLIAALHVVGYLLYLLVTARAPAPNPGPQTAVVPVLLEPSRPARLVEVLQCWNGRLFLGCLMLGLLTGMSAVPFLLVLSLAHALLTSSLITVLYWQLAITYGLVLGALLGWVHLYYLFVLLIRFCSKSWVESRRQAALPAGERFAKVLWQRLGLAGMLWWLLGAAVVGLGIGTLLCAMLYAAVALRDDDRIALAMVMLFGPPATLVGALLLWKFPALGEMPWWLLGSTLAGVLGGFLLFVLGDAIGNAFDVIHQPWPGGPFAVAALVACGPPLVLAIAILMTAFEIGLLSRFLPESTREWLGSLCGWLLIYAAVYVLTFGVVLYGGWLLIEAGPWARAALGAGWATATVGGILAGRSPTTGGSAHRSRLELLAKLAPYVFLAGVLALLALLVSTLVDNEPKWEEARKEVAAIQTPKEPSTRISHIVKTHKDTAGAPVEPPLHTAETQFTLEKTEADIRRQQYWHGMGAARPTPLLLWLGCCGIIALIMACRIDVNIFSLSAMYGNRLVRCYLGASRATLQPAGVARAAPIDATKTDPLRQPNPITGLDGLDDFPLRLLAIGPAAPGAVRDAHATGLGAEKPYWGPFPLINAALNLVRADNLAWQERQAESFVFTPLFCGSASTGYQPLRIPANAQTADATVQQARDRLTLGNAVTISGAAASPNMGYHSSPAVTALMTVFNARLGGWMRNPAPVGLGERLRRLVPPWKSLESLRKSIWTPRGPNSGLLYLAAEMFGFTGSRSSYVYLSDGGHFENLGVYELVRRRCRFIVVCDAGADPDYQCEDLAGLIRKCRTDFGVRIEIDVTPLRPAAGTQRASRWHCAIGRVRYDDVDSTSVPGILLYIKASLTGDEPSDVQNYAAGHADFPHQSTLDQFFNESQFESYRALGQHIAEKVFGDAVRYMREGGGSTAASAPLRHDTLKLFRALRRRWFPPPPDQEKNFLESVKTFIDTQKALRTDDHLRSFSRQLYPETATLLAKKRGRTMPGGGTVADDLAGLHMVTEMLQVMQDAWLRVQLEGFHAHPLNRGWMSVFRRWSNSHVFRSCWPILRGEFSQDFIRFCEQQLGLSTPPARAIRFDRQRLEVSRLLKILRDQFFQEWPRENRLRLLLDHKQAHIAPPQYVTHAEFERALRAGVAPLHERWKGPAAQLSELIERTLGARLVLATTQGGAAPGLWSADEIRAVLEILKADFADALSSKEKAVLPDEFVRAVHARLALDMAPLAWLIPLAQESRAAVDISEDSIPCGLIWVAPPSQDQPSRFELLVWLRGAYRNLGIARECFQEPLDIVWQNLCAARRDSQGNIEDFTLVVRYPDGGLPGSGEKLERAMWLSFFYDYDFRRQKLPSEEQDLILERGYSAWHRRQSRG